MNVRLVAAGLVAAFAVFVVSPAGARDSDRYRDDGYRDRYYESGYADRYDRDTGYGDGYRSDEPYRVGDRWCRDVAVERGGRHHDRTTGAVVGAIVGGAIGNRVGHGSGRTAATVGGAVAGGVIGSQVQKDRNRRDSEVVYERRCWRARD